MMKMEIRQLRYFLKVTETLNFSEASRALFITQSTLSQQINKLEQELDLPLFERNSHEVKLTEAGEHLRRYAIKAVNSVDDCIQHLEDLKQMLTGELNIGVTFSFNSIAHESLMAFLKKYPKVKLNIYYKPMTDLMLMLKRRELDIVLAFKPSVTDEKIESHLLFNTELAVVANENHPITRKDKITLEELCHYSIVLPSTGLQARCTLDRLLAQREMTLNASVEINNVHQLLQIVRESNYVTVLSETTTMHEEGLRSVRLSCRGNSMEGCIHVLRDAYLKRSAQEFIAFLRESSSIHNLFSLGCFIGDRR